MGLEDRDWYGEEPSKAWKRRWESGEPPRRVTCRGSRVHPGAWLAIVVSAAVSLAVWHWHAFPIRLGPARSPTPAVRQAFVPGRAVSPPVQANVVRLRPSPRLDTPVRQVSHWWLTDPRFGRIDVDVPVGTTPRRALTVALAARGYRVVP